MLIILVFIVVGSNQFQGPFSWEDRKVREQKMVVRRMESRRIENGEGVEIGKVGKQKKIQFSSVCLVEGVEKWRNEKLFCLVEQKSERIENVVRINLLSCPQHINLIFSITTNLQTNTTNKTSSQKKLIIKKMCLILKKKRKKERKKKSQPTCALYLGKGKTRRKEKKKKKEAVTAVKFPKKKAATLINKGEGRWVISHQTHSLPPFSLVFSLNWGENFFLLNGRSVEKTPPTLFSLPLPHPNTFLSPFRSPSAILPPTKWTLRASHRVELYSLYIPPFWV